MYIKEISTSTVFIFLLPAVTIEEGNVKGVLCVLYYCNCNSFLTSIILQYEGNNDFLALSQCKQYNYVISESIYQEPL
jgi:hypothetical protein